MRRTLSAFLMLAMVAATMMCFCAPETRAEIPPNHAHAGHHDNLDHHHGKGGASDCKGTDMQSPQHAGISAPDFKSSLHSGFLSASDIPSWTEIAVSGNAIRGPPPDWPGASQTHPPILLTTQRFRE